MKLQGRRQSTNVQKVSNTTQGYRNSFAGKVGERKLIENYYNSVKDSGGRAQGMAKDIGANAVASSAFRDRMRQRSRTSKMENTIFNNNLNRNLQRGKAQKTGPRPGSGRG